MKNVYDLFTGMDLKIAEKIQRRRYQLLIHSCIYYQLNQNIISDHQWNEWANELVVLQKEHPEISKQVRLYDYFKDWDGSTGAFLPITLPWVISIANTLLNRDNSILSDTIEIQQPVTNKNKRRLF